MSKKGKLDVKQLRAIGHKLKPVVTVAGNGVSDGVISELDRALNDHELIKIKLAVGGREAKQAVTEELCERTGAEVVQSIEAHEAANARLVQDLVAVDLASFDPQSDLHRYAVARGASVFRAQCSQCHGSGAAGSLGYPNLLDNDWLWGGTLEEIAYTVEHGIRNDTDIDARWSEMPAFGDILAAEEIDTLAAFLPNLAQADWESSAGVLYTDNCAACHGEAGLGSRDLGAPNLVDAIWLYGGDHDSLVETITNARFGVMPAWGPRLDEADVRAVSAYVHSLGGGE